MIKAIPTSMEMNLGWDQHSGWDDPRGAFLALHSVLGPTLVLIPDLVLPRCAVMYVRIDELILL